MSVPVPRRPLDEEPGPSRCVEAVPPRSSIADVLAEVHRWTGEAMTASAEVPVFGSVRWCALPDSPEKTYAAVRAALAWWTEQWARSDAATVEHVETSHALSAATDWRRVATELLQKSSSRIPRAD